MRISKFGGLLSAASPYVLPPGGAVEQTNITSLVPGQLTVRGGMQRLANTSTRYLELWGYSVGSSKTDSILGFNAAGSIVRVNGIGGTASEQTLVKGAFDSSNTVCFSQGRRGEVYIYQGYGKRGMVLSPNGKVRPVGVQAPATAPSIKLDSTLIYYVARIDILDSGNGYNLPPAVFIGPPDGTTIGGPPVNQTLLTGAGATSSLPPISTKARQAKAIARISSARVSEVEVTDGGAGYTKTPCVRFTDQPGTPVTGSGAAASIELQSGCAVGDQDTGIVWWEVTEVPYFWWLCLAGLAREGKGVVVPAVGGSGTGAKVIFFLPDGYWGGSRCYNPSADGTDLIGFDAMVQVYDFGTGYLPTDTVTATIPVAGGFGVGPTGMVTLLSCGGQICQLRATGVPLRHPTCPTKAEVIEANQYKQRPLQLTVENGGSGYLTPPTFVTEDGDIIKTEIDCKGSVTKLIVADPYKNYLFPPKLLDTSGDVGKAEGLAIMRPVLRGKYQCYYRFVNDSIPESAGGPLYSNLSPVTEVDAGDGAASMTWTPTAASAEATAVELWRTSSDQATTLFRVAKFGGEGAFGDWLDALSDYDLTNPDRPGFQAMPILLSDGSLNANRFGVAPSNFAVGVVFQDRTWLAVDTSGAQPNTLMYSEADEPEAVPEVNELILQTNLRDTDYITALIPYAGALIVAQSRHCHRLSYVSAPQNDATTTLIAYRGCLNQRCWDIYNGLAYLIDDNGFYSIDSQGEVGPLSSGLDTLFRDNTDPTLPQIDFAKREWFFVRADTNQNVIRFHVSFKGDKGDYPARQIVYSPDMKAAWIEEYPVQFSAGTQVRSANGNIILVHGSDRGLHTLGAGLTDEGSSIPFAFRTGNFQFVTDAERNGGVQQSRQISVVYKPTVNECRLNLSLYYNGSKVPRSNVVRRDRGVGFIADDTVPAHYIDMKLLLHQEAEANGVARAVLAGRTLEDMAGNDTHLSVRLWGEQTNAGPVILHSIDINGVASGDSL